MYYRYVIMSSCHQLQYAIFIYIFQPSKLCYDVHVAIQLIEKKKARSACYDVDVASSNNLLCLRREKKV